MKRTSELSLNPITFAPSAAKLNEMVQMAVGRAGVSVQLPINVGANPFLLTATLIGVSKPDNPQADARREAHWALFGKDGTLWTYLTTDLELIENMTASAIDRSVVGDNHRTVIGAPSPPRPNPMTGGAPQQFSGAAAATAQPVQQAPGTHAASHPAQTVAPAQPQSPGASTGVTLAGELNKVELSNVLQSISICKMTGKLQVNQLLDAGELFFEDGNLLHAGMDSTLNSVAARFGDSVVIEILTWRQGEFRFNPGVKSGERTIKRRIDTLVLEGTLLYDQSQYLASIGITVDSRLVKNPGTPTDQDHQTAINNGASVDPGLQKKFYDLVDGKLTLYDIIRRLEVSKVEWTQVVFNLLKGKFVHVLQSGKSEQSDLADRSGPVVVNDREIAAAWRGIMNPDSMALPYPLFMQFLLQEFTRAHKFHDTQFTVVAFDLQYKTGTIFEAPPAFAVREIMERIGELKTAADLIGHSFEPGYLMLFPLEDAAAVQRFLQSTVTTLLAARADNLFDMRNMRMTFGVAAAPFDASNPGMLLRLASMAKERGISEGQQIVLASN